VRLAPRYDTTPILAVEVRRPGPHPVVQQRRRLEAVLGELGDDEWSAPSRCEAWTAQDVITHLDSTNQFWALSITQALTGEPTRFLGTFDPVASPADLVERTRGRTPRETLDAFRRSNAALLDVIEALDEAGWDAIGEAPPGHVPVRLVADHALWDSWVHERDVLLPVGRAPVEDPGEVLTALRYASGLGQAFEVVHRGRAGGEAALDVADLDVRIVVTATRDQVRIHDGPPMSDARVVRMDSTPLLEMLSRRDAGQPAPLELGWFTAGVARVFDQVEGNAAS
jgi:uncharacterized protein (TIGR03083 family)